MPTLTLWSIKFTCDASQCLHIQPDQETSFPSAASQSPTICHFVFFFFSCPSCIIDNELNLLQHTLLTGLPLAGTYGSNICHKWPLLFPRFSKLLSLFLIFSFTFFLLLRLYKCAWAEDGPCLPHRPFTTDYISFSVFISGEYMHSHVFSFIFKCVSSVVIYLPVIYQPCGLNNIFATILAAWCSGSLPLYVLTSKTFNICLVDIKQLM